MALTFFCAAPLVFVDRPERVALYTAALYLVHTGVVFTVKDPVIAGVDSINTLISLLLGVSIARMMIRDRLECFEASRLPKQERETDALAALSNRRKLFDTMAEVESGGEAPPDGVLMLDIDHFKQFNDSFGHAAGDECLRRFGAMLNGLEPAYQARFYRYGGEEFVALVWNCDLAELARIAEAVRIAAQKRDTGAAPSPRASAQQLAALPETPTWNTGSTGRTKLPTGRKATAGIAWSIAVRKSDGEAAQGEDNGWSRIMSRSEE